MSLELLEDGEDEEWETAFAEEKSLSSSILNKKKSGEDGDSKSSVTATATASASATSSVVVASAAPPTNKNVAKPAILEDWSSTYTELQKRWQTVVSTANLLQVVDSFQSLSIVSLNDVLRPELLRSLYEMYRKSQPHWWETVIQSKRMLGLPTGLTSKERVEAEELLTKSHRSYGIVHAITAPVSSNSSSKIHRVVLKLRWNDVEAELRQSESASVYRYDRFRTPHVQQCTCLHCGFVKFLSDPGWIDMLQQITKSIDPLRALKSYAVLRLNSGAMTSPFHNQPLGRIGMRLVVSPSWPIQLGGMFMITDSAQTILHTECPSFGAVTLFQTSASRFQWFSPIGATSIHPLIVVEAWYG
jgi:hypothetical protein